MEIVTFMKAIHYKRKHRGVTMKRLSAVEKQGWRCTFDILFLSPVQMVSGSSNRQQSESHYLCLLWWGNKTWYFSSVLRVGEAASGCDKSGDVLWFTEMFWVKLPAMPKSIWIHWNGIFYKPKRIAKWSSESVYTQTQFCTTCTIRL